MTVCVFAGLVLTSTAFTSQLLLLQWSCSHTSVQWDRPGLLPGFSVHQDVVQSDFCRVGKDVLINND